MMLFRRPRFLMFTNALLVVMMLMLAARSDANCSPNAPETAAHNQTMQNCSGMDEPVGSQHPAQSHHSDQGLSGACHQGCPVLLTSADGKDVNVRLIRSKYLRESTPLMAGMSDIPKTPPPRLG